MADEQFGELAAMRRIHRIKTLGVAADLIRAHTDKFIAKALRQVARRWGRRFLDEALFLKSTAADKNLGLTDPRWPAKNDNNKGNFKDMRDKSKPALSQVTPPGAASLHSLRPSEPTCRGRRVGFRNWVHGTAAGAVQPAADQPRRTASVRAC